MKHLQPGQTLNTLAKNTPVLIAQFGADSCAPCKAIHNRIDRWVTEHPSVGSVYVPVEEFPQLAAQENVFSVPTVVVFVNGQPTLRESGYFSLDALLLQIQRYLKLLDLS